MSNNKGQGQWEEVFSDQMHELVVSEAGVGGSHSDEHDGKHGCFYYKVKRGCVRECMVKGGAEEKNGR